MLFALAAAGCGASAPRAGDPIASSQLGSFRFIERVHDAQPSLTMEGILTVTPDTIEVEMSPGPCRYDELSVSATAVRYRCGDVLVSFDRAYPVRRASYSVSTIVAVPVRVCVRYQDTTSGRRCVQYQNTTEDRRVLRTGRLQLYRVAP